MLNYEVLSQEIIDKMKEAKTTGQFPKVFCPDEKALRRRESQSDFATSAWRTPYAVDIDKIMHCPFYSRYSDKTQVFSLYKNDDITRRWLHVQYVSRIARTIGKALNLNLDLIEAIALGHDIGHTPFAHTGEVYLDELYRQYTGRRFYHNIHSVRVLDGVFTYNLNLQTLNGIALHNGEQSCGEFYPTPMNSFEEFDKAIEKCYVEGDVSLNIQPSTLEGCVVRLSDIIAYLGKDRQDAMRMKKVQEEDFSNVDMSTIDAEIIDNLIVNVIENSYGKPYIKLDKKHFNALQKSKKENYAKIYNTNAQTAKLNLTIKPMMADIYGTLLDDLKKNNRLSPIFTHHVDYINSVFVGRDKPYLSSEYNQIVVDYIASMTDNYFTDLHEYLFPNFKYKVAYKGYFDE